MADFGITEALAAIGLGAGEVAGTGATAVLGGAGETALLASAGVPIGVEAGLPAAAAATSTGTGVSLSTIGQIAGLGGTLLQAKSGMDNADYQAAVARANAAIARQNADDAAGAAERQQITQNRTTQLALSRARALAAAGGSDATSPDILTTEGRIAGQGEYNALSSLYEGQVKARNDLYQSDIDLFNARRIKAAAPLTAFGTVLGGISSLATNRAFLRSNVTTGTAPIFGSA